MEEKVLNKRKNGMAMMLLFIALYIAAAILMCIGVDHSKPLCVVSVSISESAGFLSLALRF